MEAIKAVIWLKPTEESGRQNGISQGYRPHLCVTNSRHNSQGEPNYMGVWLTEVHNDNSSDWIEPGESSEVTFALMYIDAYPESVEIYRPLQAGCEFEIREGTRVVVGTGCVRNRFVLDE